MSAAASITSTTDAWPGWEEVLRTLTFRGGFNTNVVIAGTTLLGLAAGVIGVFALLRKRSLVADALSHATLPGLALAFLLAPALGLAGRSLPVLLAGAAASGVLGVACVHALLRHRRIHEDAAIGIVLSVFFGAGVVVLSWIQRHAPAGAAGIDAFIYGQTAAMRLSDAVLMGGIALAAIVVVALLFKEMSLVCFNASFARAGGWPVGAIDAAMMGLVVLVTVAGLQAVGIILVVALLVIPPVAARFWTDRLPRLVVVAAVIGAGSGYAGAVLSSLLPRKPAGAVIVLAAGAVFALSMFLAPTRGVVAVALRRVRLHLRIAGEHVLEAAHDRAAAGAAPGLAGPDLERLAGRRGWPRWLRAVVTWRLRLRGLARADDRGLRLTTAGARDGARVARNHALWEEYLVRFADVAPSHVDWSVDQVEHVLSGELVAELERALASRGVVLPPRATSAGDHGEART